MEIPYDTFDIPTPQEIIEPQRYGKRKIPTTEFLSVEPTLKRYIPEGVSSKVGGEKGWCYVEECADTDLCGWNTELQPTNTAVEMDCATGVM